MQVKRHFSLKFVFLMPLVVSLLVLALTGKNYYDSVNRDIDDEYQRVVEAFARASKVISAIDYSFSNYSKSNYILMVEHNHHVENGLCQMWPIDMLLLSEGRHHEIPAVDINYMLVGEESLCNPESEQYQRVSGQVSLAPVLSFLHDIDDYLLGIHYIDKEGYLMSSPDTYARSITAELLATVKARPFWQQTANNRDLITITGPAPVSTTSALILSMTMPVYQGDVHQGMLSVDIDYDELLETHGKLAGELGIVNTAYLSLPDTALRPTALTLDGVNTSHTLFYQFDLAKEVRNFFIFERYSLAVVIFIYVLSVIVLFFINTRVEHSYFKELAAKDPMTMLLNRRGLEAFLKNTQHGNYIAIAVLDIDNFKSINDTYGHDVGDKVICYMAESIESSVRQSDAVARVGGEEFVIYMTGGDAALLKKGMIRVQQAIVKDSETAVERGFTISGGVEIVNRESGSSFEQLFKAADEKLYQAKTTGKDQMVF
ncbi:sensor domain-containing diguanylate cyclase [Vibrio aquaticus]|uniref:diguanylate cyclase n=1 Tax=Vibrio aquaticus TaxID=2496559 RepID=A0A3S0P6Y3_9VIBR|nr:sensor domain-containing diguanylate cyclase [Vibrio aquaticus]RTZ16430.1 sensor domain-containing diguanylate cyclase [Vibrio aquaticus]